LYRSWGLPASAGRNTLAAGTDNNACRIGPGRCFRQRRAFRFTLKKVERASVVLRYQIAYLNVIATMSTLMSYRPLKITEWVTGSVLLRLVFIFGLLKAKEWP